MPVTRGIVRGIQDIKTISGRAEKGMTYKAYMRLSVYVWQSGCNIIWFHRQ